jgi:hypothetical protein
MMSDLVKRMSATVKMGVIAPRSSADEYMVAESQFREAIRELIAKDNRLTLLYCRPDLKADNERLTDENKNCKMAVVLAKEWIADRDKRIEELEADLSAAELKAKTLSQAARRYLEGELAKLQEKQA